MFKGITEAKDIRAIEGAFIVIGPCPGVSYGEVVKITIEGRERLGVVVKAGKDAIILQSFHGLTGLNISDTRIRFLNKPFTIGVSEGYLGRIFDGLGRPIDGKPAPLADEERQINGAALNPYCRAYPKDIIQTGISAIDIMDTLVRGQKLPIFSGSGLPHNRMIAQILRQATIGEGANLAIILAAIGIGYDEALFFKQILLDSANYDKVTMFINLADDPAEERIITPRCALTLAEYLAFEKGKHVLVIITDMTNYCEALRELSAARDEVPSRKGYPGYMYTDLANLYERCGMVEGKSGSITQIPVLTMPNMDISHPIPDLTGYITEGQIVLSQDLYRKGIYPPVDLPASLSRLMKDAIGGSATREDHAEVAAQLYSLYAEVDWVRKLADIVGKDELSDMDKQLLQYGDDFEQSFIGQKEDENRDINRSLDIAWHVLSSLPKARLPRIREEFVEKYYKREPGL